MLKRRKCKSRNVFTSLVCSVDDETWWRLDDKSELQSATPLVCRPSRLDDEKNGQCGERRRCSSSGLTIFCRQSSTTSPHSGHVTWSDTPVYRNPELASRKQETDVVFAGQLPLANVAILSSSKFPIRFCAPMFSVCVYEINDDVSWSFWRTVNLPYLPVTATHPHDIFVILRQISCRWEPNRKDQLETV